ncbi:MAG TPA: hypothetical protein VM095_16535 [Pyrinomonadaceae bacterium]|nr:hypothetical protein [Pyrinomonadaceae bacterium]
MTLAPPVETPQLKWSGLPEPLRAHLERRLEGLYGGTPDEIVFDQLSVDKQQALLILVRRFLALKLWDTVRRIENLYGEGGVGMNFLAWPCLKSTLERRANFSTWFARHRNTSRGYIERGTRRAALHLLYADCPGRRGWEAHFDLYNPWASPLNAWRHLAQEKFGRQTPDWRIIGASLGYSGNPFSWPSQQL